MSWLSPDLIIFVLLVVAGIIAVRMFLKTSAVDSPKTRLVNAKSAQQFLGFQDIRENMVKIDNNRYRAIIEVEPRNFFLEGEGEQFAIEEAFRRVIDCFQYDVQFFVGSKKMNIDKNIGNMAENMMSLNPKLQLYGNDLIRFTQAWVQNRNLLTKVYYIVIVYNYDESLSKKPLKPEQIFQQAFQELGNRTMVLTEALHTAGFSPKVLDTMGAVKVYFSFYNRDRALTTDIADIEKQGMFSLYTTGNLENMTGGLVTDVPEAV